MPIIEDITSVAHPPGIRSVVLRLELPSDVLAHVKFEATLEGLPQHEFIRRAIVKEVQARQDTRRKAGPNLPEAA